MIVRYWNNGHRYRSNKHDNFFGNYIIIVISIWGLSTRTIFDVQNPDYDISIQYPNDWIPSEDNLLPHQVVVFSAPEIEVEEALFHPVFLFLQI